MNLSDVFSYVFLSTLAGGLSCIIVLVIMLAILLVVISIVDRKIIKPEYQRREKEND